MTRHTDCEAKMIAIIWDRETKKRRQLFDILVPSYGWMTFVGDEIELYVDALRYNHRPNYFLPVFWRRCRFCGQSWPCNTVEWAWEVHHTLE